MVSRFDISLNHWIKEIQIKGAVIADFHIFFVMHTNIKIDVTDFSTLSIASIRNTYSLSDTELAPSSEGKGTGAHVVLWALYEDRLCH